VSLVDKTSPTVDADGSVNGQEHGREPAEPAVTRADARFWLGIVTAVALGAAVRFAYLFHGAPEMPHSDGFTYHYSALRLADGLGYTSAVGDVGAQLAHQPPGWVTLLAGVAEAGGRSWRAHQVTGLVIGLGVIVMAGLVGARYAGRRVGIVAAMLAAVYPGFWVNDVQILAEPLGLLISGLLMLVLADLWHRPSLGLAIVAGAILGALALVRAEQLALLILAVIPIVLLNRRVIVQRRVAYIAAAALAAVLLLAPWASYNLRRFEEPVLLSTNLGPTLLTGNCGSTYGGALVGSYDNLCNTALILRNPGLDGSQLDVEARSVALANMRDNLDQLPSTVVARHGRLLGLLRPAQTVGISASWMGSATWPVWAWVASFWLIVPLAACGAVFLRRSRRFQWPLVAPIVITLLVVTVAFGEPRYHTMADLGLIVLAAVALDHLADRVGLRRGEEPPHSVKAPS
jgi:hypothetical protein